MPEEKKSKLKCPTCQKIFDEGKDPTMDIGTGTLMMTCPYCGVRFEINDETIIEE